MSINYGIGFCKKVLSDLATIEDKMFEEKGHGFDLHSQEMATEVKYRQYLKQFEKEKRLGLSPSYDPEYHGE